MTDHLDVEIIAVSLPSIYRLLVQQMQANCKVSRDSFTSGSCFSVNFLGRDSCCPPLIRLALVSSLVVIISGLLNVFYASPPNQPLPSSSIQSQSHHLHSMPTKEIPGGRRHEREYGFIQGHNQHPSGRSRKKSSFGSTFSASRLNELFNFNVNDVPLDAAVAIQNAGLLVHATTYHGFPQPITDPLSIRSTKVVLELSLHLVYSKQPRL